MTLLLFCSRAPFSLLWVASGLHFFSMVYFYNWARRSPFLDAVSFLKYEDGCVHMVNKTGCKFEIQACAGERDFILDAWQVFELKNQPEGMCGVYFAPETKRSSGVFMLYPILDAHTEKTNNGHVRFESDLVESCFLVQHWLDDGSGVPFEESAYERALVMLLRRKKWCAKTQISYVDRTIEHEEDVLQLIKRMDVGIYFEGRLVVVLERQTPNETHSKNRDQLLNYMEKNGCRYGYLVNFPSLNKTPRFTHAYAAVRIAGNPVDFGPFPSPGRILSSSSSKHHLLHEERMIDVWFWTTLVAFLIPIFSTAVRPFPFQVACAEDARKRGWSEPTIVATRTLCYLTSYSQFWILAAMLHPIDPLVHTAQCLSTMVFFLYHGFRDATKLTYHPPEFVRAVSAFFRPSPRDPHHVVVWFGLHLQHSRVPLLPRPQVRNARSWTGGFGSESRERVSLPSVGALVLARPRNASYPFLRALRSMNFETLFYVGWAVFFLLGINLGFLIVSHLH